MWVFMLASFALVFFIRFRINTLSAEMARLLFFAYATSVGLSLSTIFHVYTGASITRVFLISTATFGALSLWGYTTQRDLSGFGSFLFMGVIGIVIASIVNIFLKSTGLDWMISVIGVGLFAGLTAYDTRRIKGTYDGGDDAIRGPQGRDRCAVSIPRLHQSIHDAAAPARQSTLGQWSPLMASVSLPVRWLKSRSYAGATGRDATVSASSPTSCIGVTDGRPDSEQPATRRIP
jgi:hypothetical protein